MNKSCLLCEAFGVKGIFCGTQPVRYSPKNALCAPPWFQVVIPNKKITIYCEVARFENILCLLAGTCGNHWQDRKQQATIALTMKMATMVNHIPYAHFTIMASEMFIWRLQLLVSGRTTWVLALHKVNKTRLHLFPWCERRQEVIQKSHTQLCLRPRVPILRLNRHQHQCNQHGASEHARYYRPACVYAETSQLCQGLPLVSKYWQIKRIKYHHTYIQYGISKCAKYSKPYCILPGSCWDKSTGPY